MRAGALADRWAGWCSVYKVGVKVLAADKTKNWGAYKMKNALLFGCLAALSFNLYAATPKENLMSNEVLAGAVDDVMKMSKEELETFTTFLATCSAAGETSEALASFSCRREQKLYAMRYGRERPIDRIITAYTIAGDLLKAADRASQTKPLLDKTALADMVERLVFVESALEDACSIRFQRLVKQYK